jgi:hypothetical protein
MPWNKGLTFTSPNHANVSQDKKTTPVHHKQTKTEASSASKRSRESPDTASAPAKSVVTKVNKPTQSERNALQRQEMALIMSRILKDGFELKHVEPDGSCLFRALSLQARSHFHEEIV